MIQLTKLLKRLIIILMMIPFLNACDYSYLEIEELPDYEYSSEWVAPLIKSNMTIESLFLEREDQTVFIDEEDLVWLIYEGELFSVEGQDAYNIPNQNINYTFQYDGSKKNLSRAVETIYFNADQDEELTKIIFRSGQMNISANCPELVIDGVQIEILATILNSDDGTGNPISFTFSLANDANVDLSDNILNFGASQSLDVQFDVSIVSGSPVSAPYTIEISQQFSDMEFFELRGYLKQRSFALGADSVDLGFFKNVVDGEIYFEDPLIEILAQNSYGIPFNINFDAFFSAHDDQTVNVTGVPNTEVPSVPWLINHPAIGNPGELVSTQHDLDKNNSNIHEVMEILPRKLAYEVTGETNPDGDGVLNHVRYDSYFSIGVTVHLPFHGRLNLAGFRDTVDLELPAIEQVEWLELIVNIVNGMPFSSYVLLDVVDENYNLIKTLFHPDQAVVLSADIDENGNATSATTATTEIRIDKEDLDNFENAKYIIVRARVTSYGDGQRNIYIYSHDELNVYIAAKAGINEVIDLKNNNAKK